jgi:hypothetical protein
MNIRRSCSSRLGQRDCPRLDISLIRTGGGRLLLSALRATRNNIVLKPRTDCLCKVLSNSVWRSSFVPALRLNCCSNVWVPRPGYIL